MGGKDSFYRIVYHGQVLEHYKQGEFIFFQRAKEQGGGYWLGQTFDGVFVFTLPHPTKFWDGWEYLIRYARRPPPKPNVIESGDTFPLF
ncbi:hypothetical protein RAC65_18250 [Pantoea sp. BS_8]|uniref:hypothetical protein n=1 Tax=Pantoea sp. BS_8 TaxID=3055781 RepID=UPI0035C1A49B